MNISVIGCGYVGLAVAAALSSVFSVTVWDINAEKLMCLKKGIALICDESLKQWVKTHNDRLRISESFDEVIRDKDLIFLALPTDLDNNSGSLDVRILDETIERIRLSDISESTTIVIKSTVPIGYTKSIQDKYNNELNFIYVPEFLREGTAYFDCVNPERLVVGGQSDVFNDVIGCFCGEGTHVIKVTTTEAETIKLLSNAYLAMRVTFFNEVDSLSEYYGINSYNVIRGICMDSRIGDLYNIPSPGYGGYCLPKDIKQVVASFPGKSNCLFSAVVESNEMRKRHIADLLIKSEEKRVGINRLQFKKGTDSCRGSAVLDIVNMVLKDADIEIYVFEPGLDPGDLIWNRERIIRVDTLEKLKRECNIVLTGYLIERKINEAVAQHPKAPFQGGCHRR